MTDKVPDAWVEVLSADLVRDALKAGGEFMAQIAGDDSVSLARMINGRTLLTVVWPEDVREPEQTWHENLDEAIEHMRRLKPLARWRLIFNPWAML